MSDINYLFCAGDSPTSKVWKISISTMAKASESANYGTEYDYAYALIYTLAALEDYIYCGGYAEPGNVVNRVWKINKTSMVKAAQSDGYGSTIHALTAFDGHVYCGGSSPYRVWKIDVSDMSKIDESAIYGGIIRRLINDGTYIYCAGSTTKKVWKIDPSDMSKIAESASYGGHIYSLVSDGTYLYCGGSVTDKVYKIRISDMSKVAESANYGGTVRALTVSGGYVYCGGSGASVKIWKIRTSDMVKVDESGIRGATIYALANDGTYVYCGGHVNVTEVWKVAISDMSKIAELDYEAGVRALLVSLAPPLYDYPLAPVMFPAKQRGTSLQEDCRNLEESMSDVCLVLNHNVNVTREYLQLTYGDTTHPESSNLRYVLPSQQLIKLSNKDLTEEDFKAIINNFVTNISSMFTLINQNNRLVKTWLDDYEPDELGHDFTDVKMRPIVVGKDLSKTMDELFERIGDNVIILNMNLEVLKERL